MEFFDPINHLNLKITSLIRVKIALFVMWPPVGNINYKSFKS